MSASARPGAAFYCVADERYFLGAVALVNSLRLHGHSEPIYVCDAGLTGAQRALLETETIAVEPPAEAVPHLLKAVAPLERPAEVMVLIDTDMIVCRSLAEPIAWAAAGRLVAVENDVERFVPEWGELLGVGPARRRPYLSSGLVFADGTLGEEVFGLMWSHRGKVDFEQTFWRRNVADYPFLYGDQDLFNAILATRVDPGRVTMLPQRLAALPPFRGLRVRDLRALRCAYDDGTHPYVLHHFGRKPWLEPVRHGLYSRAMARALLGPDLAIRIPVDLVPLRMRGGASGRAQRAWVDARDVITRYLGEPLARRLRPGARSDGTGRGG